MALHKIRLTTKKTFGRFPKTEVFEANDKALREEYEKFIAFDKTEEYAQYIALKEFVESGEPLRVKKELENLKYSGSEEQQKELQLKSSSKDSAIKNYLKIKDSELLAFIQKIELSGKPSQYNDIKELVESAEYKSQRSNHKKDNTDEYKKELIFKQLKKDSDLKKYFKTIQSTPYKDYIQLEESDKIKAHSELQNYVDSAEFKEKKAYLLSKKKFELSEASKKKEEYKALKKSETIVWYESLLNSHKFEDIKRWELAFSDEFNEPKLDSTKWITRYYWGEALLNKGYSLATDKHWYPDQDNIEISNSILKITTQKQDAQGLGWDFKMGFIPKQFEYTSGIISTGHAFRQQYGRFEAKVRFSNTPGVYHAFWLVGDTMLPHIDVFRKNSKNTSTQASIYSAKQGASKPLIIKSKLGGFNFSSEFFVLSIDWDQEKIIWSINGVPYMEIKNNIPNMPAYLVFSSGVVDGQTPNLLPATLEVDWVKCWKKKELA